MHSELFGFTRDRVAASLRRRLGGYLAIALLVGLVGGLATASVAGARRTQSTYPRYLAAAHASDLEFQPYLAGGAPTANLYSSAFTGRIAHLAHVTGVAAGGQVFAPPDGPNGQPYLPAALQNNEVNEIAPIGGLLYSQDRVIADQGKVPDPTRTDEFAGTAPALKLLHWRVGQEVSFGAYTFAAVSGSGIGVPTGPPAVRFRAKLVGVVALDNAVVHDEVDAYPTFVIFSPALVHKLSAASATGYATYFLRLDHGARDVSAVEKELISLLPPGSFYNFHVTAVAEGQVERATKPESIALGVFGAIAGLAALLIAGQAISRAVRTNRRDLEVLRALGAGPAMLAADALTGVFGAILAGSFLAAALCVLLSPVAPLGVVRQVDPSPGFTFDWLVLGAGFALFVVTLTAVAVGLTFLAVRARGSRPTVAPTQESSRLVSAAARMGLPPASIAGIRFAVERGRGEDAVPVGSALLGAVLAVAVVVTTLTFGNGLSTLVSHPSLYGWNWSYAIETAGSGNNVPPVATNLLSKDKYVASWTGFNFADAQIDGQTVPILIVPTHASFGPPILSGHAVEGSGQVVLGGTTLAQLHKHLGDTVVLSYGSPQIAPVYVPPTTMRIVGTATFPAIGNAGSLHVSMGTGVMVPEGVEPPAMRQALTSPDPNQNGPGLVAVRLRSGVSASAALASLHRIADTASRVVDQDPNSGGGTFVVLPVQQPAEIVNYKTMGATPAILASGLAVGAVAALGLTLVASVRRRRRDLALLKTLGFVQGQVAAVVSWQASVAALVGIVVGVPLGIIFGRTLWSVFAHEIFAVPKPTIPALEIVLAAVGALVLANLVAFVPGRIAARTPTAALLRKE